MCIFVNYLFTVLELSNMLHLSGKTISNKSIDLSAASYSGITPLHDAVANNHVEVAKLLITHGGKPND